MTDHMAPAAQQISGRIEVDRTGRWTSIDAGACEVLGQVAGEALGFGWLTAVSGASRVETLEAWAERIGQGRASRLHLRLDGRGCADEVEIQIQPTFDRLGLVSGWIGLLKTAA
ncbi:MAG: hypothetical protein ACRD0U_06395 [Acidimicrobiales bacterium]